MILVNKISAEEDKQKIHAHTKVNIAKENDECRRREKTLNMETK